jgi:hypothetical protein
VPSSLSCTLHCAVYSEMKSYSHTPLAKPATHVHWYACTDTVVSVVESEHVAPFWHGRLTHSLASMLQFPLLKELMVLSVTEHCAMYCCIGV